MVELYALYYVHYAAQLSVIHIRNPWPSLANKRHETQPPLLFIFCTIDPEPALGHQLPHLLPGRGGRAGRAGRHAFQCHI